MQQHGSYQNYVNSMQSQIDELNKIILIARTPWMLIKPDMKYIPRGARNRTVSFLTTRFCCPAGGTSGRMAHASEFQQGTIRLLLIRPKTRTKILTAKFVAALLICLGIYMAGSILNMVTNGYASASQTSCIPTTRFRARSLLCITSRKCLPAL